HILRGHEDFIPELDLVVEADHHVIGNIMYTKTMLIDEAGLEKPILTFGPVSILPQYQRCGYGKKLMEASFERAIQLGYDVIVIFGNPDNYVSRGFKSCQKFNISLEDGVFPAAMMAKELKPGVLDGRRWVYRQSAAFELDEQAAQRFDDSLPPKVKSVQPSQEEFYIHSHAIMR
ncbi:MAG TPA: N-acetyltransferase, partial [Candidatus Limiplasma sp.]|nr:N-acetyltransferase [Candidatus Limiplasma sp.]